MKTVEETKTGLPSFETEWPKQVNAEGEAAGGDKDWSAKRLHHMLQSSIPENTWHGFQGYDSPLAG